MKHNPYPLEWPLGQPRTPDYKRRQSRFRDLAFAKVRDDLLSEIGRLGGSSVVLSTNVPLRRDGLPLAAASAPPDPGVAVYFRRNVYGLFNVLEDVRHYALGCDAYRKVAENMRALASTIAAIRTIERHGSAGLLEQALSGFTELPPAAEDPGTPWWQVLGFQFKPSNIDTVRKRWHELASQHHPDRPNGSREAFELYRRAFERACEEGV